MNTQANRKKYNVLIESDWNLKYHLCMKTLSRTCRINRIRLEFKGMDPENR